MKMKKQTANWEKTFMKHISNKGFVFGIYKELLHRNDLKIQKEILNGQKD